MLRLVFCLRRRSDLSREEFQRYWREVHGPLVQRHSNTLRIRRYQQVHTLDDPLNDVLRSGRGAEEAFDGVAELWWDSVEALAAAQASPEGQAASRALFEDERRFIDHARSPIFVGAEHVFVGAW